MRAVASITVIVLIVAACGSSDDDPAAVLADYAAAYNAGDIDAVMVLFSEESVITGVPFFESAGLTAIRAVQVQDINAAAEEDAYSFSNVEVSGNTVTWDQVWVNKAGEGFCLEGQSVVIKDGKILSWTWPGLGVPCP